LPSILLCFTLFSFTGCEDKKGQDAVIAVIPVENTTEVFVPKDQDKPEEKKEETLEIQEAIETQEEIISKKFSSTQTLTDTFTLSDIQQNTYTVSIVDQKMMLQDIDKSIVILNFFSTWSAPSRGEIPYLSDLQEKYKKDLFIAGILVNDVLYDNTLKEFISKNHANYFISNSKQNDAFFSKVIKELHLSEDVSLPLTVIYKDGDYYTHYEGAVPVEMIDHDIRQVIK